MPTPEQRSRSRAYYLAHKEKMDAQVKAALHKRLAAGAPRPVSSFRPGPDSEERKLYRKDWKLRRNYGMSLQERHVQLGKQEGLCAICCAVLGDGKDITVDHCHATGKVRGLLCQSCNRGLGCFADNSDRIMAALRYLKLNSMPENARANT